MICADFLAGAHLDNGNPEILLNSISRYYKPERPLLYKGYGWLRCHGREFLRWYSRKSGAGGRQ